MNDEAHKQHRERLKKRFLKEGLDSFEPHVMLELLLFFSVPRIDTNGLGHALIRHFGSLSAVFDAPFEELCKIPGIGKNSATLIKLVLGLNRHYFIDKNASAKSINSTESAGRYLLPHFLSANSEIVMLLCMDSKCKILGCEKVHEGSINSTEINIRKIAETCLKYNATAAIIAHNHPGGIALPSGMDISATGDIKAALRTIGIELVDHIIVADGDFVSLSDSGVLE